MTDRVNGGGLHIYVLPFFIDEKAFAFTALDYHGVDSFYGALELNPGWETRALNYPSAMYSVALVWILPDI